MGALWSFERLGAAAVSLRVAWNAQFRQLGLDEGQTGIPTFYHFNLSLRCCSAGRPFGSYEEPISGGSPRDHVAVARRSELFSLHDDSFPAGILLSGGGRNGRILTDSMPMRGVEDHLPMSGGERARGRDAEMDDAMLDNWEIFAKRELERCACTEDSLRHVCSSEQRCPAPACYYPRRSDIALYFTQLHILRPPTRPPPALPLNYRRMSHCRMHPELVRLSDERRHNYPLHPGRASNPHDERIPHRPLSRPFSPREHALQGLPGEGRLGPSTEGQERENRDTDHEWHIDARVKRSRGMASPASPDSGRRGGQMGGNGMTYGRAAEPAGSEVEVLPREVEMNLLG